MGEGVLNKPGDFQFIPYEGLKNMSEFPSKKDMDE